MKLSEGNLALLQSTPSRSPSPENSQEEQLAEIKRECDAYARRLTRQGRADCLARQNLVFTEERLRRADGREIPPKMTTWQNIERSLAAEFAPLPTNLAQARKLPPRGSQARLQQKRIDERYAVLKKKLGSWFKENALSGPLPPLGMIFESREGRRIKKRAADERPSKLRRSGRLSGKPPEFTVAELGLLSRRV